MEECDKVQVSSLTPIKEKQHSSVPLCCHSTNLLGPCVSPAQSADYAKIPAVPGIWHCLPRQLTMHVVGVGGTPLECSKALGVGGFMLLAPTSLKASCWGLLMSDWEVTIGNSDKYAKGMPKNIPMFSTCWTFHTLLLSMLTGAASKGLLERLDELQPSCLVFALMRQGCGFCSLGCGASWLMCTSTMGIQVINRLFSALCSLTQVFLPFVRSSRWFWCLFEWTCVCYVWVLRVAVCATRHSWVHLIIVLCKTLPLQSVVTWSRWSRQIRALDATVRHCLHTLMPLSLQHKLIYSWPTVPLTMEAISWNVMIVLLNMNIMLLIVIMTSCWSFSISHPHHHHL